MKISKMDFVHMVEPITCISEYVSVKVSGKTIRFYVEDPQYVIYHEYQRENEETEDFSFNLSKSTIRIVKKWEVTELEFVVSNGILKVTGGIYSYEEPVSVPSMNELPLVRRDGFLHLKDSLPGIYFTLMPQFLPGGDVSLLFSEDGSISFQAEKESGILTINYPEKVSKKETSLEKVSCVPFFSDYVKKIGEKVEVCVTEKYVSIKSKYGVAIFPTLQ